MLLKFRLAFFCFLLSFSTVFSQNIAIKHYTIDDGLPSNTVYSVFFDSKGYMWIGTNKGLAIYNGKTFKIFTTYDGLPDNEIFAFNEDLEGRIWISNFKGVLCYFQNNIFHTEANTPWLKFKTTKVPSFYGRMIIQKDSSILTEALDGTIIMEIKGEKIKIINLEKLIQQSQLFRNSRPLTLRKLAENRYQSFYFHQISVVDSLGNVMQTMPYKDSLLYSTGFAAHHEYLTTQKGIYNLEGEMLFRRDIHPFNIYDGRIIYYPDKNNIFILSGVGLRYNKTQMLLDSVKLNSIDHDNLGNIWLGSIESGLFCLSKDFNDLHSQVINSKILTSQRTGSQICFITDKGSFYNLTSLPHLSFQLDKKSLKGTANLFERNNSCITDSGALFWLHGDNIFYKRKGDNQYKTIKMKSAKSNSIASVLVYPIKSIHSFNSDFYVSTRNAVLVIHASDLIKNKEVEAEKLVVFTTSTDDRIFYSNINKSDTTIWLSTANKITIIKNGVAKQEHQFDHNTVRKFDFYGDYLVGSTDNNELLIYNTKSKYLDSLPNSNCIWEDIYKINDQMAVINTNSYYRILKLRPPGENGRPRYDLQTIEAPFVPLEADYIFGDDSTCYFLKNGLLSRFPNKLLFEKSMAPTPIFVSLQTGRSSYFIKPKISLSYDESKVIKITIDNISYANKELVTQYSISNNGKDDWNTISGSEINLNGASYGTYVIKLRSRTISSNYSTPQTMILEIAKPFWAKWWFIVFCIIIFAALLYLIIQLFIQRNIRKTQKEHNAEIKFQQSEYKALNALMNPHFIFNSLNNIQSLINKSNSETANQYLVIFSKLIRQNMLNVSKGFVSLYQELQLVENYLNLEKLRFKDLINFTFEIDENVDTEDVMISPLLIQPLVENAIIHGLLPQQSANSELLIKVFEVENSLYIQIIDNGIGLARSLKNKNEDRESYGLTNLHRRIDHLKKIQKRVIEFEVKEILDENGSSKGTMASIEIKL